VTPAQHPSTVLQHVCLTDQLSIAAVAGVISVQAFNMPPYKNFDKLVPGDDAARVALQQVGASLKVSEPQ
jgi:hypothetical protein